MSNPEPTTETETETEGELPTVIDLTDGAEAAEAVVVGEPTGDVLVDAARAIEAIVMVATDPIPDHLLAQLIEMPVATVRALCAKLADDYRAEGRGFEFVEVAGGWRYQSHPAQAPYVERFALEGQTARLSGAALETLAIVAYKQPISRGQVSAIRGVNADGVLRTLEQRGYVEEVGRDDGPGQAILLGTTVAFLERLGLASPEDLPALGDFVPSAAIVEALEHTLRVDPEPEADTAAEADPDPEVDPALAEQPPVS